MRLDGGGPGETIVLHYPDLMLVDPAGHRIAIELALVRPGYRRLESIIAAYGADPNVAVALYLVDDLHDPAVGDTIQTTAAGLGLSDPTHVQRVRSDRTMPGAIAQ